MRPFVDTLLLSATYEPIAPLGWQRAMTLWCAGRVEVLEASPSRIIRTVDAVFPMPSVVRYLRGRHRRRTGPRFTREGVFVRDGAQCQYCGMKLSRADATYDHVIPRRLGGDAGWENMVLCCFRCNQRKGGMTPDEAGMPLRRTPQRPAGLIQQWLDTRLTDDLPSEWHPYLGVVYATARSTPPPDSDDQA